MPTETKTSRTKITFDLAASLRKKFNAKCKKRGLSASQRLRDLVQKDVREEL